MRTITTVGFFITGMYCLIKGYYWWAFLWMLLSISPFVVLFCVLALVLIFSLMGCTTTTYNTTNNVNIRVDSPIKNVRDSHNPYYKEIK
jgi:hypothetical protein